LRSFGHHNHTCPNLRRDSEARSPHLHRMPGAPDSDLIIYPADALTCKLHRPDLASGPPWSLTLKRYGGPMMLD